MIKAFNSTALPAGWHNLLVNVGTNPAKLLEILFNAWEVSIALGPEGDADVLSYLTDRIAEDIVEDREKDQTVELAQLISSVAFTVLKQANTLPLFTKVLIPTIEQDFVTIEKVHIHRGIIFLVMSEPVVKAKRPVKSVIDTDVFSHLIAKRRLLKLSNIITDMMYEEIKNDRDDYKHKRKAKKVTGPNKVK